MCALVRIAPFDWTITTDSAISPFIISGSPVCFTTGETISINYLIQYPVGNVIQTKLCE